MPNDRLRQDSLIWASSLGVKAAAIGTLAPWQSALGGAVIGGGAGGLMDYLGGNDDNSWDGILDGATVGGLAGYVGNPIINALGHATGLIDIAHTKSHSGGKALSDVLPDNYMSDAAEHAKKYREKNKQIPYRQRIDDAALNRKVKITSNPVTAMVGNQLAAGTYSPAADAINIPPGGIEASLPHELTHAAQTFPAKPQGVDLVADAKLRSATDAATDNTNYRNYLGGKGGRHETEAFLADIKRQYFKATGKHVKGTASASDAINWKVQEIRKNLGQHPLLDVLLFNGFEDPEKLQKMLPWLDQLTEIMPGLVRNNSTGRAMPKAAAARGAAANQMSNQGALILWQRTPQLVRQRYKEASAVQAEVKKVLQDLPIADLSYGYVYWHPQDKKLWSMLSDGDETETYTQWKAALNGIPGVTEVRLEAEVGPPRDSLDDWIQIKRADALLNKPYELAGRLTGGPSPLSNSIVSGLLGGGLGYAGGALAEQFLPESEDPEERGKLRRSLATMGALGGAAMHIPQWIANTRINQHATGQPHWLRSLTMGDQHQNILPHENAMRDNLHGIKPQLEKQNQLQAMEEELSGLPEPPDLFTQAADTFVPRLRGQREALDCDFKQARQFVNNILADYGSSMTKESNQAFGTGFSGSKGVALRPVPVDAFNRAIWNDVHNGNRSSMSNPYGTRSPFGGNDTEFTTPPVAAAATGLVAGVQQMYGGAPLLSPVHFIRGLAAAGVDGATATVAGGVLGVLGGLSPEAQKSLQRAGMWGGLIRGVTSSVLGL